MGLREHKLKREKQLESLEFKQKFLNKYGHKTMLVIYNILGYFVNQKKKGKKCFLTKQQIRENLLDQVSFPTIKKAKKILEHFLGIKTVKVNEKSARVCKYEWVIGDEFLEENPNLELGEFWNILERKVKKNRKEKIYFKFFKFRNFARWIVNMGRFWDKKEKMRYRKEYPSWFDDGIENFIWLKNKKLNL